MSHSPRRALLLAKVPLRRWSQSGYISITQPEKISSRELIHATSLDLPLAAQWGMNETSTQQLNALKTTWELYLVPNEVTCRCQLREAYCTELGGLSPLPIHFRGKFQVLNFNPWCPIIIWDPFTLETGLHPHLAIKSELPNTWFVISGKQVLPLVSPISDFPSSFGLSHFHFHTPPPAPTLFSKCSLHVRWFSCLSL